MTFIPQSEKEFPYQEGDLLLMFNKKEQLFYVTKILKIERVIFKQGEVKNIAGQQIMAPEDDYFLSTVVKWTDCVYHSPEEAQNALQENNLTWEVTCIPMRPTGILIEYRGLIGHQEVTDEELQPYHEWKRKFDTGEAGIW